MRLNKKCFPRVASSFSFCSFGTGLAGLSDSELSFDGFSSLEHAFPSDEVGDTFDEDVNEGSLRLSESIGVGDIPSSTNRGGVDTSDTTGLEGEGRADLLEVFSSGEVGELNHGSGSESSSEVGGAGEDETEMLVVHEVVSVSLEDLLDGLGRVGESNEDGLDVVSLLHGDDSHVIFLVQPDEEIHVLVVEDTSGVGPVATASGGEEEGGVGLLEEVTSGSELLFLGLGHTVGLAGVGSGSVERVVVTLEFTSHVEESLDDESLDLTSLFERVARGKSESSNGSTSSASGGENVLTGGIDLGAGDVVGVHVTGVDGVGRVSTVSGRDDLVHELSEEGPGLFITGNETACSDHGVTLVVNTGLDAVSKVNSELGNSSLESVIDSHVSPESISAEVSVSGEVGEVIGEGHLAREEGTLLSADVFVVTASSLDPGGEGPDVSGETVRRVITVGGGNVGVNLLFLHHVGGTGSENGGSGEGSVVHATFRLLVGGESTNGHGGHGSVLGSNGTGEVLEGRCLEHYIFI